MILAWLRILAYILGVIRVEVWSKRWAKSINLDFAFVTLSTLFVFFFYCLFGGCYWYSYFCYGSPSFIYMFDDPDT